MRLEVILVVKIAEYPERGAFYEQLSRRDPCQDTEQL